MQNIHLVVIDPQFDFANSKGSLYVPKGEVYMDNVSTMINRLGPKITKISISLDCHYPMDVSHPGWWVDADGNHPNPFTIITAQDCRDGKWTTTIRSKYTKSLKYLETLEAAKRYPHCIWPVHCVIGTEGNGMHKNFQDAVMAWCLANNRNPTFISKGSNVDTEHFSAIKAEVPDPKDPSTQVNLSMIRSLERADIVLLSGLARSHCLANTGYDIRDNFSDPSFVRKLHLLTDGTGDVPGFENLGDKFVTDMTAGGQGMQLTTTVDFLRAA